jgi:formamidopyrimidine-DNA glycosylase
MPELPEVETIRRQLEPKLVGQIISNVEILSPKSFCGDPKKIIGKKIISLTRIGKQLSINLSGNYLILAHFKMTGGLFFKPSKYTRIILKIKSPAPLSRGAVRRTEGFKTSGGDLFFNDLRKFGWLRLFTKTSLKSFQKNLGIDILSSYFTDKYFYDQLLTSSRPIKNVLLDQTKFAGIGNIYACDSLFLSKINPTISSKNISFSKSKVLRHNLQKIMTESILHGGSTARDRGYIMPDGNIGTHQDHFLVYQRENEKCFVCNTKIKRIKQSGRSTFYCPHCQKTNK